MLQPSKAGSAVNAASSTSPIAMILAVFLMGASICPTGFNRLRRRLDQLKRSSNAKNETCSLREIIIRIARDGNLAIEVD
ncbi:MAG: hypothetical protein JW395_2341 [Nitrospira sp.]|nr:hypothetical protein [Nitrospira sp.]